jgi:hypothetical protein
MCRIICLNGLRGSANTSGEPLLLLRSENRTSKKNQKHCCSSTNGKDVKVILLEPPCLVTMLKM